MLIKTDDPAKWCDQFPSNTFSFPMSGRMEKKMIEWIIKVLFEIYA
jgi:hypothetical protein